MRLLAARLVQAGFHVLRFDYFGTGDSCGQGTRGGATPEGKKELVGFQTGVRESAQSWRELLIDIERHGFEIAPDLAVGDGALGFWKAIELHRGALRHSRHDRRYSASLRPSIGSTQEAHS